MLTRPLVYHCDIPTNAVHDDTDTSVILSKTFFNRDFQLICSQRSPSMDKAFSACCLPQGVKNRDQFPAEVVEAYKYTFSRPGALTGPINYYRAMFSSPKDSLPREKWTISVPTLRRNKHTGTHSQQKNDPQTLHNQCALYGTC